MNNVDPRSKCPVCEETTHPIPYGEVLCHKGHDVGSVNVRYARQKGEVEALEERYQQARAACDTELVANRFEEAVLGESAAVFNCDLSALRLIFEHDGYYLNYYEQRERDKRPPTDIDKSRQRLMADAYLFPDFGECIRHGALYLGGLGARNYGLYALVVRDKRLLDNYASTLEENSYHFFQTKVKTCQAGSVMPSERPPEGYRSDWQNRHKIALAKHVDDLSDNLQDEAFQDLLLHNGHNRGEDEFIEVHVYGDESPNCPHIDKKTVAEVHCERISDDEEDFEILCLVQERVSRVPDVGWVWH